MKNIKKLLFPVATIAATAGLVTPLLTSCGATSSGITEIGKGYTPSIQKHGEQPEADPDSMSEEYLTTIKSNTSIIDEDFKYSAGQIYELVDEAFKETSNTDPTPEFKPELTVNSFKAGATDIEVSDAGKYTYKNGITTSLTAKLEIDVNELIERLTEQKPSKDYGDYKIVINANNLGYETKFTNFEKFNVTHASTILEDGKYTLVQPVFPSDLTEETWAVDFKLSGDLNVTVNGVEVISWDSIDLTYHYDHDNIILLYQQLSDTFSMLSSGIYVIDVLQELGSFASYYLSDVTCADRLIEESQIVDFSESNGDFVGTVTYYGPSVDGTKCEITHFDADTPAYAGSITKTTPAGRWKANLEIDSEDLPNALNEINYAIVKQADDNEYVHEWKERHTIYPRFNINMDSYDTTWYSNAYSLYTYDTPCVFTINPTTAEPIGAGAKFRIYDEDATTSDKRYMTLKDVVVTADGTALKEGTDYSIVNGGTAIKFAEARADEKIVISLKTNSTLEVKTQETASGDEEVVVDTAIAMFE